MANKTAKLIVDVVAKDKTKKGLKDAQTGIGRFKKGASAAGVAVGAVTTAVVGLGTQSLKTFAQFDKQMSNLKTLLGGNTKLAKEFETGILNIARKSSIPLFELGQQMYALNSAFWCFKG